MCCGFTLWGVHIMNPIYERPATILTQKLTVPNQQADIDCPVVTGLNNLNAQQKINSDIVNMINRLVAMQAAQLIAQGYTILNLSITGQYEVKSNEKGVLSLIIINYTIASPAAHGLTIIKSLTFDTATGNNYLLGEEFKQSSNYVRVLSDIIKAQIKARDIELLNGFDSIKPDQDYYIADKALVVYFQQYEIAAYVYGLPMFPISVYDVQNIIRGDSPLGMMPS
jgi:hypothetical protein